MANQEQTPRVKISSLWTNETKDGKKYLSGGNGSIRYSIWPNGFKEKDTDPDWVLYVEQAKKKEGTDSSATPF
ncbi:hypothetical protein SynROS8604_02942 [Synechococcus sp. ROS8604]|nr:hypothetical protein SynROS8604_02942 [Synechococcus sp. ROS8604]